MKKPITIGMSAVFAVLVAAITFFLLAQPPQDQTGGGALSEQQEYLEYLEYLDTLNGTERLLMFIVLTPEQEATVESRRTDCDSLVIENNRTAMNKAFSCRNKVGDLIDEFQRENLQEVLVVADRAIASSVRALTLEQVADINQLYLDCLWAEVDYYYAIGEWMVDTCQSRIKNELNEMASP